MNKQEKTLKQLFIPIFLETLFLMLVGSIDTIMLSSLNDKAVGAVGTANTYLGVFIISFSIIASGMIAVMTQYIGSNKPGVAGQAKYIGLVFNGFVGIILSIVLITCTTPILVALGVAPSLMKYCVTYMKIVGGTCIVSAIIPVFTNYLRAFGYTKQPLFCTIISNILNAILNALFLYICHWGVAGVALATVISKIVGLILAIYMCHRYISIPVNSERIDNKIVCLKILKIGLPAAMESALYNLAMAIVMKYLNQMDSDGINVTVKSYASQFANFSFCAGAALAQANAILVGWHMGSKKYDECYKGTLRAARYGIIVAIIISGLFALFSRYLMEIFTDNTEIISLCSKVMIIDIFLEFGRVANLVFGNALKTSGDAFYTVIIAVIFMYVGAVLGTYILGLSLEMMIIGCWIALAIDECCRALLMYIRWHSKKWLAKSLV